MLSTGAAIQVASTSNATTRPSPPREAKTIPMEEAMKAQPSSYQVMTIKRNHFVSRSRRFTRPDDVMVCDCVVERDENGACVSPGCGANCINRLMFVECDPKHCPLGDKCTNNRFSTCRYSPVSLLPPNAKGYGLRTNVALKKGDFVMEYVGEVLDQAVYDQRKKEYKISGSRHFYFMSIGPGEVIDATRKGNLSRFLNHSCNPNCETQKWQVGGELCIGVFAKRDIESEEELTFDYHFERDGDQVMRCLCGESNCRGFIGASSSEMSDDTVLQDKTLSVESYDPAVHEPKPVMVRGPPELAASSTSQRRASGDKQASARQKPLKYNQIVRGQTEVERILESVTNRGGGLKDASHALDVLRIMNANMSSRFELSMIFDVLLQTPTKAMREAFVKLNALGALQVLMNRFRSSEKSEEKLFLPLLRKALDVVSFLPLSKEVINKTKTAKSSFDSFLFELVDHSDTAVAEKANKLCEKYLPEDLLKKQEEEAKRQEEEQTKWFQKGGGYRGGGGLGGDWGERSGWKNQNRHNSAYNQGKENKYDKYDKYDRSSSRFSDGGGGGGGGGGNNKRISARNGHSDSGVDAKKGDHEYDHKSGSSSRKESDYYGSNGWGRDYERDHYGGGYDESKRRRRDYDYDYDYEYNGKRHSSSHFHDSDGWDSRDLRSPPQPSKQPPTPLPPHLMKRARANVGALPAKSTGERKSSPSKKSFKEITDNHIWTSASEDFKGVVREIIQYRVKKLAMQKAKSLYKDKQKMDTIVGKLYNRVIKKEVQNLDGNSNNITLHSELVKKVDHYTRSHLKGYFEK